MKKVSVIGMGRVGAMLCYELAYREVCDRIVAVDINKDLAHGQRDDISQALCDKSRTDIVVGDYDEVAGSDVVVITAGKPRTPEIKSRLDLAMVNKKIMVGVAEKLVDVCDKRTVFITVTNPLDVMNYVLYKYGGFERNRVVGSGCWLDSLRFRWLLAKEFNAKPADVEAYVIGEHGEGHVPLFSSVRIDGKKIEFDIAKREKILAMLQGASMDVLIKKGCTEFAPAHSTADMIESVIIGEDQILPCSMVLNGEYGKDGVSIGVPMQLGVNGGKIVEWQMDDWEQKRFNEACDRTRRIIKDVLN